MTKGDSAAFNHYFSEEDQPFLHDAQPSKTPTRTIMFNKEITSATSEENSSIASLSTSTKIAKYCPIQTTILFHLDNCAIVITLSY